MIGLGIALLAIMTYVTSAFSVALAIYPETRRREIAAWGFDDGDAKFFAFLLGSLWPILPIVPGYLLWPRVIKIMDSLMPGEK